MAAAKYNLVIDQGSDFSQLFTVSKDGSVLNLSGYSARAQLRKSRTSDTAAASFTTTIMNAAAGQLNISLANSVTKDLEPGRYFYDVEIYTTNDAQVTRIVTGEVTVTREYTK